MTESKSGRRVKQALKGLGLVAALAAVILFGRHCVSKAGTDPHTYRIDFNVYYAAWQSVWHTGGNPYAEQISPATPYLYPPLFAQLLAPLGRLSLPAAAWAWYLIGVASLAGALVLAGRLVVPGGRPSAALLALSFIAVARFALDNLGMGQINPLVVALALLALFWREKGWSWPAALALATAVNFKLTPALFIVYFCLTGHWRFALRTGAIAAGLAAASFLPMGRQAPAAFDYWYSLIILNRQGFGWGYHGNQSWRALVHRLLTDEHTGAAHLPHINLAVDRTAAAVLYYLGAAAIILAIWWVSRRRLPQPAGPGDVAEARFARAVEYGLVFCAMLMISSLSWKDHYVALLLPYATLVRFVFDRVGHPVRDRAGGAAAALIISFVLCTLSSMALIGAYLSERLEVFSAVFLGAVCLFAGLIYVRTKGLYGAAESEVSDQLGHRVAGRVRA